MSDPASPSDAPIPRSVYRASVNTPGIDAVFSVLAVQQNRGVRPWMAMERPVIIAAQKQVQVDIQEPIARDEIPPEQVGESVAADHLVGRRIATVVDEALG